MLAGDARHDQYDRGKAEKDAYWGEDYNSASEEEVDGGTKHPLVQALRSALIPHLAVGSERPGSKDFRGPHADNGPVAPAFFNRTVGEDVAKAIMGDDWTGARGNEEEDFSVFDRLEPQHMSDWFDDAEGEAATQAMALLNGAAVQAFAYTRCVDGGNHYSLGVGIVDKDGWAVGFRASPVMF